MTTDYTKPALNYTEQLNKLKGCGMTIIDDEMALGYLSSVSYYRLSAYWYFFRNNSGSGKKSNIFRPDTCFEDVIQLYSFDKRLRYLMMNALEFIEISLRTKLTYHFAMRYGPFGHTNASNFHPKFRHQEWLSKLDSEVERSSDEFVNHFKTKYNGYPRLPIWMLTEVMSFGSLSMFYKGFNNNAQSSIKDKEDIAKNLGIHYKTLEHWLHVLTYVRNVCAHHSRIWNRELAIRPQQLKDPLWNSPYVPFHNRVYHVLLIIQYLLKQLNHTSEWTQSILELLSNFDYKPYFQTAMGMPSNWKEHPLWK